MGSVGDSDAGREDPAQRLAPASDLRTRRLSRAAPREGVERGFQLA
jgi:hypothetical protein